MPELGLERSLKVATMVDARCWSHSFSRYLL